MSVSYTHLSLCVSHRSNNRNDLYSCFFPHFHVFLRISCTGCNPVSYTHLLITPANENYNNISHLFCEIHKCHNEKLPFYYMKLRGLDVYKRQPQTLRLSLYRSFTHLIPSFTPHTSFTALYTAVAAAVVIRRPVSYTHLDVYKRQY